MTAIDLFAGSGGLSLGLREAGIDVALAVERDADASFTYQRHHPSTKVIQNDLATALAQKQLATKAYGGVDLLCGGPPCQGFSQINRFRDISDPRNTLVELFFGVAKKLKPRAILMENVTGILTLDKGSAFKSLLNGLSSIGYSISVAVIQAGAFGLPQNRWRVFVVGLLNSRNTFEWPKASHFFHRTNFVGMPQWRAHVISSHDADAHKHKKEVTVRDAIADLPANPSPSEDEGVLCTTSSGTKLVYDHVSPRLEQISLDRCKHIPEGGGWLDLPERLQPGNLKRYKKRKGSFDSRWGRLSWSGTFPTIVTKPEPYWGRYLHPTADRVVTVRECARAQGFGDDVRFYGRISSRYRQVGNAVPPPLAKAIAAQLKAAL